MGFFSRLSPVRALVDLRRYLATRQPYELWFGMASLVLTGAIMIVFLTEQQPVPEYRPNIVYVQQWRADRTDAQIIAQQKIDQVQRDKDAAEQKKREEKLRAGFKRLDDSLTRYGL